MEEEKKTTEEKELEQVVETNNQEIKQEESAQKATEEVETKYEERQETEIKEEEKVTTTHTKEISKNKKEEKSVKSSKKKVGIIIGVVIATIVIMIFSIIFALLNMNNNKILKGISVLGIDVGNLTVEEAKTRVNDAIEEKFNNENDNIVLKRGELEVSVDANTFNAKFDVDSAVAEAYNTGRNGNIITNNYSILWTKLFKKEINPTINLEEEFMKKTIVDTNAKMEDVVTEYSYYIDGKTLTIKKGKAGNTIKTEELETEIKKQLNDIHNSYKEIEIPVEHKEPDPIDLQKIKNEIYKEPKDAYVEKNPTRVHLEVDGVDFGVTIEEAQKIISEDKEEYKIPLKITKAKKKLADLGEDAFPDLISKYSTIYDASNRNRSHNIQLASKKINGTIVMPGEIFSYNKITGEKTVANGYKEGTAYVGGKVVPDIGGGVCQVSSTLYNVALLANLQITERTNHMFLTSYVPASRDATVYDGSLDFCFKNTRKYPVKITASASNGVCKVNLYGIKEEVEYNVIIQSKVNSYINYKVTYKEDPTLEEGKEVVEQAGHNGCKSEGYKILKLNGKIISQTLLSKDTYSAQERIVRKGTKKVVAPTTGTGTSTSGSETTSTGTTSSGTTSGTTGETTGSTTNPEGSTGTGTTPAGGTTTTTP